MQVPGLFEGDEYATLMTQCKEGAQKEGLMLDTHEELYKWFTSQVIRNLHVVFTMNPSSEGLKDRAATSPALFNRFFYLPSISWVYNISKTCFLEFVSTQSNRKCNVKRNSVQHRKCFCIRTKVITPFFLHINLFVL